MERPSVTSGEAAAQAALAAIEQVPLELKIDATADAVTFIEPRGQAFFRIDGKTANVEVPDGTIRVKCRWDGSTLRQEFSSTQRMLRRSWSVDHDGRLRLTQRVEGLSFMARDSRAVFDRQ